MTRAPLDRITAFLAGVPPFNVLPAATRSATADRLLMEYFPKGETFIRAGEKNLDHLYVIFKGAVRLFVRMEGQESLLDMRAEGDCIGSNSLLNHEPPVFNAAAAEDTICYLVPGDCFRDLCRDYPQFGIFSGRVLQGIRARHPAAPFMAEGDPDPTRPSADEAVFTTRVRDLLKRPPVYCRPDTPIRQAAQIMTREQVGSLMVVDEHIRPVGIVTDRDLRRLVAEGRDGGGPVSGIMVGGLAFSHPDERCYNALLTMGKRNIHHLPVVEEGRLTGVVTRHDLLLLSGNHPLSVIKDIETAPSADQLALIQNNLDRVVEVLVRQDASSAEIQDVVSLANDRLMRRLVDLGVSQLDNRGMGQPPLPWAWIGLGSAGRREQIMRSDHDCAIVYADPLPGQEDQVQEYFLALAEEIISGLERCGFPRCREGNTASNPRWCQSTSVWAQYCRTWLHDADADTLKSAALFFDARFIYGLDQPAAEVFRGVRRELTGNTNFLRNLAAASLMEKPPLGFFRRFVVEKSGEHKSRFNIKTGGLQPLVDSVRILALKEKLTQTNTLERLKALGERGALASPLLDDAADAFDFMFRLRIKNYVSGLSVDRFSFNWLNPDLLERLERQMLKEAFRVIARMQSLIIEVTGL